MTVCVGIGIGAMVGRSLSEIGFAETSSRVLLDTNYAGWLSPRDGLTSFSLTQSFVDASTVVEASRPAVSHLFEWRSQVLHTRYSDVLCVIYRSGG